MKNLKKTIATTATIAGMTVLLACGSGSNNDQGVSFSALTWASVEDNACTQRGISGGVTAPISLGNTGEVLGASLQAVLQCMIVENRMTSQFVRTDRIYYTFSIPGASVQPPSTSMPFSVFLPQVAAADTAADGGTGTTATETRVSYGAYIVPPQIFEWISLNRESLPSTPFQLEVYARVSGVTASGDRLETNEVGIPVMITEDQVIAPSPGPDDVVPTPVDETGTTTGTSTETSI